MKNILKKSIDERLNFENQSFVAECTKIFGTGSSNCGLKVNLIFQQKSNLKMLFYLFRPSMTFFNQLVHAKVLEFS